MLRYLRSLADKDLALDRTMIPLGSCTMKLNSTSEMIPVTWPEFSNIHPFAPDDQTVGYREMIGQLEAMLCAVTGYAGDFAAAERRLAGRIRGPAGDPEVPPVARRRPPQHLPDPVLGARHQPGIGQHGRHAGGGHGLRRERQRRPRRPEEEGRAAQREPGLRDGDLPVDARRVRRRHPGTVRDRPRARRPGLHRRRQHERAGRRGGAGRLRRRRQPPEPAQDLLHPARRRRSWRRPDRRRRAPGPVPAEPALDRLCARRRRHRRGQRGGLRLGLDPADLVDVHRDDGRRRPDRTPPKRRS
jgi:hypothetical protein